MSRPLLGWVGAVVLVAAAGLLPLGVAGVARAADAPKGADKSAAELLPSSTLFYAEVSRPKDLIGLVLDNPAVANLVKSPQYQQVLAAPQFKQLLDAVALVEQRAGVKWRPALETITGGGIVIAIDPATGGGIAMVRSEDPKTTAAVRDALFALAREDATNKGNPDPVKKTQYRELVAHKVGEAALVECGPWLLATNKPDLAKAVANAYLDGPAEGESLAESEEFVAAREQGGAKTSAATEKAKPTAWGFVRLPQLRLLAAGQPWMKPNAKSDNPGAELIFGGLVGVIQKAPYATMSIDASPEGLKLAIAAPNDPSWVPEHRNFYFAPPAENGQMSGGAAPAFKPKGTLLSLTTYRDVAAMWQAGPDLFDEGVAAQMAQTDSGLSTFLGGKSFGTDVLNTFKPQIQFIVTAQDYKAAGVEAPAIRIPAFASVVRLKGAEAKRIGLTKHMRFAFQSLVAVVNLDGVAKNRPMLEMQNEKRGGAEIHWAVYERPEAGEAAAAEGDAAKGQAAEGAGAGGDGGAKEGAAAAVPTPPAAETRDDFHQNFSPALVISPDYLMLCSTREIAQELADLAAAEKQAGKAAATVAENTAIELDAKGIAALLHENREQLVANNMLTKGQDRPAAEQEIDFLVGLLDYFRGASLRLTPTEKWIELEVDVKTATK
jgi:hypothetical protein